MASNIDTLPSESGTTAREAPRPPEAHPPSRTRRTALTWAAIIAACIAVAALAVATFTGGGNDNVDTRARRLAAEAERHEREAHLEGQAKTYGGNNAATNPGEADSQAARKAAEAERHEREAHLEGQAKTYGKADQTYPSTDGSSNDEFVPGSRHMPTR